MDRSGLWLPQPHDGTQGGRLARAIAAKQDKDTALGHIKRDIVQDVILPDLGFHLAQGQQAHAVSSVAVPR